MLGNLPPRDAMLAFASERESICRRKEAGEPWPWSFDATLNRFSFTNVRREDDKTTRHYARAVRAPYTYDKRLLAATVAYRWFNRIETGDSLFTFDAEGLCALDRAIRSDDPAAVIWAAVRIKPPPHVTGAFYVPSPKDAPGLSKGEGISILVGRFLRDFWLASEVGALVYAGVHADAGRGSHLAHGRAEHRHVQRRSIYR